MLEFIWLSEHKELYPKFREIKLEVFKDDLMREEEQYIFEFIANQPTNINITYKGTLYGEIDYALIKNENDFIGIIGYYRDEKPGEYWLGWYGIKEKYRTKGYGEAALLQREHYLTTNKFIKAMRIYTGYKNNAKAVKLYEKLGYKAQSEIFTKDGENDIIILGKNFAGKHYKYWNGEPVW